MDAPPANEEEKEREKMEYEGEEYDYVFSIDVKDDSPALRLPYNLDQDVGEVAATFIALHALPESYLDQIIEFIRSNSSSSRLSQ